MTLYCVWLLFNREARPVVYLAPAAEEVSKDEAVSLLLNTRHETCRCMSSCNAGVKSVECHLHALCVQSLIILHRVKTETTETEYISA